MNPRTLISSLAENTGGARVSIYIPTHVKGPEIQQDPIRLKNALSTAQEQLEESGMDPRDVSELLSEAAALIEDQEFWRYQQNGLAVFIGAEGTQHHKLPFSPHEETMIGDAYFTLPLFRLAGTGENFYVLALNRAGAALYEADADGMKACELNLDPEQMAKDRGYSDFNDDLGGHGAAPGGGESGASDVAQTHALGTGKDEQAEKELERFLTYIEKDVDAATAESDAPIVLVGGERIVGRYRALAQNQTFAEEAVHKNTESMDEDAMHEAACRAVSDLLRAPRDEAVERILARIDSGEETASVKAADILEAAEQGRVDTALINFKQREGKDPFMLDAIARATLQNGGKVLATPSLEDERLNPVAALYRY